MREGLLDLQGGATCSGREGERAVSVGTASVLKAVAYWWQAFMN